MVADVDPLVLPARDVAREFVLDISVTDFLFLLDTDTSHYTWISKGGLGFQSEKIMKQIPLGFNSQESFTKMHKHGMMSDRGGVKMVDFKVVCVQKATKEIRGTEG